MKDILTYIKMILIYPPILIKELFMQKIDFFHPGHSTMRMINGMLLFFGGIGLVFYTILGYIIYHSLR